MRAASLVVITLVAITSVFAAPLIKKPDVEPHEAACSTTAVTFPNGENWRLYDMVVGEDWNYGLSCTRWKTFFLNDANIFNWQCFDDLSGKSHAGIHFEVLHGENQWLNQKVIDGLQKAFPDVPFQRDRICLADSFEPAAYWPKPAKVKRGDSDSDSDMTSTPNAVDPQRPRHLVGPESVNCTVYHGWAFAEAHRKSHLSPVTISVQIGRPYENGVECSRVLESLHDVGANVDEFLCRPPVIAGQLESSNTLILFTILREENKNLLDVNKGIDRLDQVYPTIGFKEKYMCILQQNFTKIPEPIHTGLDGIIQRDNKDAGSIINAVAVSRRSSDATTANCKIRPDEAWKSEIEKGFAYTVEVDASFEDGAACEENRLLITTGTEGFKANGPGTWLQFSTWYDKNKFSDDEMNLLVMGQLDKAYPRISFVANGVCKIAEDVEDYDYSELPEGFEHVEGYETLWEHISRLHDEGLTTRDVENPFLTFSNNHHPSRHTAVCDTQFATKDGLVNSYKYMIWVGEPWADGNGCPSIKESLERNSIDYMDQTISEFVCVKDEGRDDMTGLAFKQEFAPGDNGRAISYINAVLQQRIYPKIMFQTDGICKDRHFHSGNERRDMIYARSSDDRPPLDTNTAESERQS